MGYAVGCLLAAVTVTLLIGWFVLAFAECTWQELDLGSLDDVRKEDA